MSLLDGVCQGRKTGHGSIFRFATLPQHMPGNLAIDPSAVSRTSSAMYLATAYAADP